MFPNPFIHIFHLIVCQIRKRERTFKKYSKIVGKRVKKCFKPKSVNEITLNRKKLPLIRLKDKVNNKTPKTLITVYLEFYFGKKYKKIKIAWENT